MAFLTQKDFFKIRYPDPNNPLPPPPANPPPTYIKTYGTCFDPRAWSFNKHLNSKFILDEVHRNDWKDDNFMAGDGPDNRARDSPISDQPTGVTNMDRMRQAEPGQTPQRTSGRPGDAVGGISPGTRDQGLVSRERGSQQQTGDQPRSPGARFRDDAPEIGTRSSRSEAGPGAVPGPGSAAGQYPTGSGGVPGVRPGPQQTGARAAGSTPGQYQDGRDGAGAAPGQYPTGPGATPGQYPTGPGATPGAGAATGPGAKAGQYPTGSGGVPGVGAPSQIGTKAGQTAGPGAVAGPRTEGTSNKSASGGAPTSEVAALKEQLRKSQLEAAKAKNERDQLSTTMSTELVKITTIEDKIGELKDRAERSANIENERDKLAEKAEKAEKELKGSKDVIRQLSQRNSALSKQNKDLIERSNEIKGSLVSLTKINNELAEKIGEHQGSIQALNKRNSELMDKNKEYRASIEELATKTVSNNSMLSKTIGKDMANTKMQLSVAESAINEYEKEIKKHIDTINNLNKQIEAYKREQQGSQSRLNALDELEAEVDKLQSQLSTALQLQKAQPMADLLSAVKLTLLYVQNKLTSRETFGNEAELERLKAELLNLRERRDSDALEHSRSEVERLKKIVNNASRERLSQEMVRQSVEELLTASTKNLRDEMNGLRNELSDANDALKEVASKANSSVLALQTGLAKDLETSRNIISGQNSTIQDLQQHIEQSVRRQSNLEQDMSSQIEELEQDNAGLRDHISIINGQMDELGSLIEEIEQEREQNRNLQEDLANYQETLSKLPSDVEVIPPMRNTMNDALNLVTDQLEQESQRSRALSEQNANLRGQVISSEERLQRLACHCSELELAHVTSPDLAAQIVKLNRVNNRLNSQLSEFRRSIDSIDEISDRSPTIDESANAPSSGSLPQPETQMSPREIPPCPPCPGKVQLRLPTSMTPQSGKPAGHERKRRDPSEADSTLLSARRSGGDTQRSGNFIRSKCLCSFALEKPNESEKELLKQEVNHEHLLNQLCAKILQQGIKSLNLRQLSQLHHLIYLAGIRYMDEIRQRRHCNAGHVDSVRQRQQFYRNKENEHKNKVSELQQQLSAIQQCMLKIHRHRSPPMHSKCSGKSADCSNRTKGSPKFRLCSKSSLRHRKNRGRSLD